MKLKPDTGVSTFANHYKPNPQTKVCKRASTFPAQEKLLFKISFSSKIFKTATTQPTHKAHNTNLTETAKSLSNLTFTTRTTERQLVTAVWQKWRFRSPQTHLRLIKHRFSASTFVVKIATFAKPQTVVPNAVKP